jgi:hypothetical protein
MPVPPPPPPSPSPPPPLPDELLAAMLQKLRLETAGLETFGEVLGKLLNIDPGAHTKTEIAQVCIRCKR